MLDNDNNIEIKDYILVVEDSKTYLQVIKQFIKNYTNYEVMVAQNYGETKKILESKEYNFFASLTDLHLPDSMDGNIVDLLLSFKIPTIVLTSSTDENVREKLTKKAIVDYIIKSSLADIKSAIKLLNQLKKNENIKILVVDDSKTFRSYIGNFLKLHYFNIFKASDGIEALKVIEEEKDISMVLTDYHMPNMDGFELTTEIRKKYSNQEMAIIVLSSDTNNYTTSRFLKNGANDYLLKSFSRDEFFSRVYLNIYNLSLIKEVTKEQNLVNEYKRAVDGSSIVSKTDINGIITYVNDEFCKISGYDREELIGKSHNIIRHLDTPKEIFKDLWDTILAKKSWKGVIINRAKNGTAYWVDSFITPILDENKNIISIMAIRSDITKLQERTDKLKKTNKQIRDSIEYASLIQGALIPDKNVFAKYTDDYFAIWKPRDVVGGDIYLLEELRNENEFLLMVIDCAGHGVPGAFVTMLTKAIERQIIGRIVNSDEIVSPAKILTIFNKSMKHLLKQEKDETISNAGFDGGILYYNKKDNIIKYAGAKTPLYIIRGDKLEMIKSDRQSIGYKRSKPSFEFKDHIIELNEDTQVYITTDGYLDQSGGEEGFPFGKKEFQKLIFKNREKSFKDQEDILIGNFESYKGDKIPNDDVTVIGMKFIDNRVKEGDMLKQKLNTINKCEQELKIEFKVDDEILFEFNGIITQSKVVEVAKGVEKKLIEENVETSKIRNIFEVIVEIMQNILSYSCDSIDKGNNTYESKGKIIITHNTKTEEYLISSCNLIEASKKEKIINNIDQLTPLNKDELKKLYKETRRSRKTVHNRGAGLGFIEMARKSIKPLEVTFSELNTKEVLFTLKVTI